eukprot:311946-Chlamydomonas_euryale.AAC.2
MAAHTRRPHAADSAVGHMAACMRRPHAADSAAGHTAAHMRRPHAALRRVGGRRMRAPIASPRKPHTRPPRNIPRKMHAVSRPVRCGVSPSSSSAAVPNRPTDKISTASAALASPQMSITSSWKRPVPTCAWAARVAYMHVYVSGRSSTG